MKKILCLIALACALCLMPASVGAQSKGKTGKKATASKSASAAKSEAAKPAADDAAKADAPAQSADAKAGEKKDDAKAGDKKEGAAGMGLDFGGGDFPFDKMEAVQVEFNPDGLTVLTGKVRIESKDMNISCELLRMDNKTKMVIATGNPVKMDQGPGVQAQCRNLTYNLDTKSATLENEASIIQDQNGKKTHANADTIKIDQDPKGGKPKISLMMRPDSGKVVQIEMLGQDNKPASKSQPKGATRVNDNNIGQISLPVPTKVPGSE